MASDLGVSKPKKRSLSEIMLERSVSFPSVGRKTLKFQMLQDVWAKLKSFILPVLRYTNSMVFRCLLRIGALILESQILSHCFASMWRQRETNFCLDIKSRS